MKRQSSKRSRIRIFGGPNGSGKSTILEQINYRFDIGFYINADEIEKTLKVEGEINFKDFGIEKFSKKKFDRILNSHSIVKKAQEEGYKIDLIISGRKIINPNKAEGDIRPIGTHIFSTSHYRQQNLSLT